MVTIETLIETLRSVPVIPVLTIDRLEDAEPLGRALVAGGLTVLEVTLRTPAALDAVRAMRKIDGALVGAGTVLDPEQAQAAMKAGAQFLVSPGTTHSLLDTALKHGVPLLPGVATVSEAMAARAKGYRFLKFFPAGPAGGPAYLKALAAPLADLVFCPTGGIDRDNARAYLDLPNVACIGGSWVAPVEAVRKGDFAHITTLAQEAARMRG